MSTRLFSAIERVDGGPPYTHMFAYRERNFSEGPAFDEVGAKGYVWNKSNYDFDPVRCIGRKMWTPVVKTEWSRTAG